MTTSNQTLCIRSARQLGSEIAGITRRVMFAPGGVHTLTPAYGPASVEISIRVDASTAAVLNASLAQVNAANNPQRAFFDKNHEGKEAMAWPLGFEWSETPEPGVYATVEWSSLGEQYVSGKVLRAFSGSFYTDADLPAKPRAGQTIKLSAGKRGSKENPARMVGLGFPDAGTLTNDPAFRKILPIWAKNAGGGSATGHSGSSLRNNNNNTHTNMKLTAEQKAALQASIQSLEQDLIVLKAQNQQDAAVAEALQAKQAELEAAQAKIQAHDLAERNERLETALLIQRTKDADDAVKAAVTRGAIPAKDITTQDAWKKKLIENPSDLVLLQAMRGSPALQQPRISLANVQIVKEDQVDILRAYQSEKDPRKRGLIYAQALNPLLANGERIAFERAEKIMAANSLGTLVGDIISQRTLALMSSKRPMLNNIVTDFSSENAKLGQTVTTRAVGLPTVQNFGGTTSETADTDYDVTMSAHKEVRYTFTPAEYLATGRDLVGEHSLALAVALGNHLVDFVAGLITDAFTSETTGAGSTKDYTAFTTAGKALNTAGAPDFKRFGWVNADFAEALKNDEVVMENWDKGNASAYGHWKNIHGFEDVWEYPGLPGNSVNLIGFFGQQNALLLTTRVMIDPSALIGAGYPGLIKVVTDPVSGLSVVSNQFIDATSLAVNDRLIILYGGARGLVAAGHKFVTT